VCACDRRALVRSRLAAWARSEHGPLALLCPTSDAARAPARVARAARMASAPSPLRASGRGGGGGAARRRRDASRGAPLAREAGGGRLIARAPDRCAAGRQVAASGARGEAHGEVAIDAVGGCR
jgi:hypothetical protein